MALQFFDISVIELVGATCVSLTLEHFPTIATAVAVAVFFSILIGSILYRLDFLEHFEYVVVLVLLLLAEVILVADKELKHFPDLGFLMTTHLQ